MPKRILQGVVVSDKNDKTIVVQVERRLRHPVLKKTVRLSKKYHAHDEKNEAKTGDIVRSRRRARCRSRSAGNWSRRLRPGRPEEGQAGGQTPQCERVIR